MPQGEGTYGSQVGRPSKKSGFKMKGWSPFTKKTIPKVKLPKKLVGNMPTEEQLKKQKGELFERDITGFRRDDWKGTIKEREAIKAAKPSQWKRTKSIVKKGIKEGTFWGWPIDKWGGGKR